MTRLFLSAASWFLAVVALVCGVGLIALGGWHQPFVDATESAAAGRLDDALGGFEESESRFNRVASTKRLVPEGYDASVANQLAILYRQRRFDDLIEKAGAAPSSAATHFWAGCALFAKGKAEEKP
jgi:hypothetical protein